MTKPWEMGLVAAGSTSAAGQVQLPPAVANIKAQFVAGKLTRDQAKAELKKLGID